MSVITPKIEQTKHTFYSTTKKRIISRTFLCRDHIILESFQKISSKSIDSSESISDEPSWSLFILPTVQYYGDPGSSITSYKTSVTLYTDISVPPSTLSYRSPSSVPLLEQVLTRYTAPYKCTSNKKLTLLFGVLPT